MLNQSVDTGQVRSPALPGKYLTFRLAHQSYGLPVLKVREIIRSLDITPVPRMPPVVKGVINLRGKVIPVLDLAIQFSRTPTSMTDRTCIVVTQAATASGLLQLVGIIVDAVEEVTPVNEQDIEPLPDFGWDHGPEGILGLAKLRGAVKALLDIDRVIAETPALVGGESHSDPARAT